MKVTLKKIEKVTDIEINTEYIKLDSFIKFANISESGGNAKLMIQDGDISVNGAVCTQRGKKLRAGDTVEAYGIKYRVVGI